MKLFCFVFYLFLNCTYASAVNTKIESETLAAFQYLIQEVEQDETLSFEEQNEKIHEFKMVVDSLSPEAASQLTILLLQETRARILDILQNASLDGQEIDDYLSDFEEAIHRVKNMNVEIARQMLFFVAELKINRQYVYDFGVVLGCPEKQLLHHDL